ncbi:MAG TPA: hypothetical protein VK826_14445 [Bacteroidia bacterium]|nr:hypothetical protein [Bacteroidia bacterium]
MKNTVTYMLMIALMYSCSEKPDVLPSGEYISWTESESSGLINSKTIDDITFSVYYLPKEAMALRETGASPSEAEWKSVVESKGDMQYYKVVYRLANSNQDILKYNLYDENEYFSRTNYLAFGVDKDVYLLSGKDKLPCRMHQFTPHYGISPEAEILFAFDEPDKEHEQNKTFVIEDQLFGTGILQFEFTAENIKNIPSIQF